MRSTQAPGALQNVIKLLGVGAHTAQPGPSDPALGMPNPNPPDPNDLGAVGDQALQTSNTGIDAIKKGGKASIAAANKANKSGKVATAAESAYEQDLAKKTAPVYAKANADAATHDAAYQAHMATLEKEKTAGMDRYLAAVNDLKNTHVHSWWSQAGTGAQVLGIVSQALAGGLQGLTGQSGPTPLDRIIDQDLQRQKMNLAQKSDVAQQSGDLYHKLIQQFGDEVQAEAAFKTIAYNGVKQQVANIAGTMGGQAAQAAQKKANALLDAETAKLTGQAQQFVAAQVNGAQEAKNSNTYKAVDNATARRGQDMAAGKGPTEELVIPGIPDSGKKLRLMAGTAGQESVGKQVKQYKAAVHIQDGAREMAKLLTGANPALAETREFQVHLNQLGSQINADLAGQNDLGAVSGGDLEMVQDIAGFKGGASAWVENQVAGGRSYADVAKDVLRLSANVKKRIEDDFNAFDVEPVVKSKAVK